MMSSNQFHLKVPLGIPVMLQEDDCVRRSQVEAQAADMRGQQHDLYGGVTVEALHQGKALGCRDTAGSG